MSKSLHPLVVVSTKCSMIARCAAVFARIFCPFGTRLGLALNELLTLFKHMRQLTPSALIIMKTYLGGVANSMLSRWGAAKNLHDGRRDCTDLITIGFNVNR